MFVGHDEALVRCNYYFVLMVDGFSFPVFGVCASRLLFLKNRAIFFFFFLGIFNLL